jgi:iron(III) transport system ATP-binding protein
MDRGAGVTIEHIHFAYGGTPILSDVSLTIGRGEFFAFLGPSGSGKTTLLRLIAGFGRPARGRVLVGARDVTHLPPWQRNVGMVFQNYALWPHMTVAANVAFGLEQRRLPRAEIRMRVAAVLDLVGLGQFGDRRPAQLSGGQQQRVALARAIVGKPSLLLADEPTGNLDSRNGQEVMELLKKLNGEGTTIVLVTHNPFDADYAQRIINLFDGTVVLENRRRTS